MNHEVIRLQAADFEELIAFLSRAFRHGDRWFAEALSALYQPTDIDMANNFAMRVDGRLAAVVGLFPITMVCGDATLQCAGIGGVSTDPDFRGQGLMKQIMARVVQEIHTVGYDLSYLGGQRQRYRYWGWERCGLSLRAELTRANLRHEPRWQQVAPLTLEPVDEGSPHLPAIAQLHSIQSCRAERQRLRGCLVAWSARPFVGLDVEGQVAAYVCLRNSGPNIDEIVARDADAALGMVRAVIEAEGDPAILLDPLVSPALQPLVDMAETVSLMETGNWQVFNWSAVVKTLLQGAGRTRPLSDGRVVLAVGAGTQSTDAPSTDTTGADSARFEIIVKDGHVTCQPSGAEPTLRADGPTLTRALFGPWSPSQILDLPREAAVLDQWCPLPLYLSRQDMC